MFHNHSRSGSQLAEQSDQEHLARQATLEPPQLGLLYHKILGSDSAHTGSVCRTPLGERSSLAAASSSSMAGFQCFAILDASGSHSGTQQMPVDTLPLYEMTPMYTPSGTNE